MLIECPYCGGRLSDEFTILGDATKQRPSGADATQMEAWDDYIGSIAAAAAPGWWSSAIP